MSKRPRSPNYPAISLPEALERLQKLWNSIQRHPAPRDLIATGLGYSGLHGASATAVSALRKYGLLERDGGDLKISERGMMCLHPENPEERASAIRTAALAPELFATLTERFPDGKSNEELLRNYLLRNHFTPAASSTALLAYRETMELVEKEGRVYDSGSVEPEREAESMTPTAGVVATAPPHSGGPPPAEPSVVAGKFRVSMTDQFFVDVNASQLDRDGVQRLINWLQANQELVPEAVIPKNLSEEAEQ